MVTIKGKAGAVSAAQVRSPFIPPSHSINHLLFLPRLDLSPSLFL